MSGVHETTALHGASLACGEQCPAAHLLVGPDGCIRGLNRALAQMLGYQEHEMLGRHVLEFVQPRDTGRILEELGRGSQAAYEPALEVAVRAKDGTPRALLVARNPLPRNAGPAESVAGPSVLLTGIDITDNRTEQERAHLRELQAHRERHMESIAVLARSVASHFETLLTAVSSCAEKLRAAGSADRQTARAVENVLGITTRASRITAALARFGRDPTLRLERVEPRALIDSALESLRSVLGHKVEIVTDVPSHLPTIYADADALREALVELALNARDAMPAGGTFTLAAEPADLDETLCLSCGSDLPAGRYLQLSAADTGEGMNERTLGRAFEPFFTTRNPEGWAGLGLSKVHGCVAAHHGSVGISSSPGKGTKVTILLPAAATGA